MKTRDDDSPTTDEQVREQIRLTAAQLFRERGYAPVSLREIADAAGLSVEECLACFANKDAIALEIYSEHIEVLAAYMAELPDGQLADRYRLTLTGAIAMMRDDRGALAALFGAAMNEDSMLQLMDGPLGRRLSEAYHRLVLESDDALREPKARELGLALYTFHMLLLMFWLYDRSPEQAQTDKLLDLAHGTFKQARPLFFMPMIPQGIAKLAEIVMPDAGDASMGAAAQDDSRDG